MAKQDVILSAPPVVVAGSKLFFGYSLPEWAAIVTIAYTSLLLGRLLWRAWKEWRSWYTRKDKE